jgi:hypothetical protein
MRHYRSETVKASNYRNDEYEKLESIILKLNAQIYENKVFFWWFRSAYAARVAAYQAELERALAAYNEIEEERRALLAPAKKQVGLWSSV